MSVRAAIVGAGWMGEMHAQAIHRAGDKVALVVDADISRARQLATRYHALASNDLDACRDCHAAVLTTPTVHHLSQSEQLAELGLSLLVEKPHRFPQQDSTRLRAILQRQRGHYQVGMSTRFHPGIQALAQAVAEGQLGQILNYSDTFWAQLTPHTLSPWYFDRKQAGGGVMLTNGVHLIDRCTWILGQNIVPIYQRLSSLSGKGNVEDYAHVVYRGSEQTLEIRHSMLWSEQPVSKQEISVVGSSGVAWIKHGHWFIEGGTGRVDGTSVSMEEVLALQWQDFAEHHRSGTPPNWNGPHFDTLESVLATIEAIYQKEAAR